MKKSNPQATSVNGLAEETPSPAKPPFILKVFGLLAFAAGATVAVMLGLLVIRLYTLLEGGSLVDTFSTSTIVIFALETLCSLLLAGLAAVFGVLLLQNNRRHAARLVGAMIVAEVGVTLCHIMLTGFQANLIPHFVVLVFLVVVQSFLDPSLSGERELQRKLRKMETREEVEDGTLGLDKSGKGFIALNFFNIFWIFVVCSVLGLILETIYHFTIVDPGQYQDRAGLLFGPFSPIYGFGAVLMTIALNRFHNKSLLLTFVVSAIVGGAFEFATSWFMESAFGIVAWDYTGTFLSIDGRTNFMFMCIWGLLGVIWVKLCLPWMLKIVNLIPWKWRYVITTICATLMIIDGAMTLFALDCWYQREAGNDTADNAITEYFDEHFDNDFMEERFQSMSIDTENATRTS